MDIITTATLEANIRKAESLGISSRQAECAAWAADGKTDSEIGMIIGRTSRTAKKHVQDAMERTNTHTRAQLVAALFVAQVFKAKRGVIGMGVLLTVLTTSWVTAPVLSDSNDLVRRYRSRTSRSTRTSSRIDQLIGNSALELYSESDFSSYGGRNA